MEEKNSKRGISRRGFIQGAALSAGALAVTGMVGAKNAHAAPLPKKWDMESDVVVVGYGGAGACAALEAARAGCSVLLLEKLGMPGGSTTMSGGIVYASGTKLQKSVGINDTPDAMYKYLMACGQGRAVPELVKLVSDMSSENIDWLASMGAVFTQELLAMSGMENEPEYTAVTPAQKRGHRVRGTGSALFKVLADAVKAEKNIQVMTRTSGTKLFTRSTASAANLEVVGLAASSKGKAITIKAKKAVILTTGGIMPGAESEGWLKDYSPDIAKCVAAGSTSSTGDGYRMGISCGGALKALNTGGTLPSLLFPGAKMAGIVYANIWGLPNIYVKADGTRFCNEGANYTLVSEAMFQRNATTAYCIFDAATVKKTFAMVEKGIEIRRTIALGIDPGNLDDQVKRGYLWKGETIADLAKAIGIDGTTLTKTLDAYNRNAENGKDLEFGRTKALEPLKTGPYYAFKINPGLVAHDGGLSINTKSQVIDSYDQVIPRLYAAGRDSAGIFGGRYPASGAAIADLLAFGRIAGKTAATEKSWK
ncbi:MAG: FAD-dependent oxidoreductase [Syntrophaceae bacterium]|nr:FAD-dependent oxidoreductase [Syntrophaceae bacterium]